ncbi:MAG: hypothetical protein GTO51_05110 [Candidatus Latescibacteria bacterium]|nr:hypothetical protein [Candidatus Latescibacterota bacterium]NIO28381.1 hypothetical protein [Candidatus Latescibacterota bacterium]NIO55930.1 hypothetical protein [Candidatus Latescibacterota bacterium]NIT01894.1 hypothetical protein [Candidatus Latescibacterota bacterium]
MLRLNSRCLRECCADGSFPAILAGHEACGVCGLNHECFGQRRFT